MSVGSVLPGTWARALAGILRRLSLCVNVLMGVRKDGTPHTPPTPPQFQKRACVMDGVIAWCLSSGQRAGSCEWRWSAQPGHCAFFPCGIKFWHLHLPPPTAYSCCRSVIHVKSPWLCPRGEKDLGEILHIPLNSHEVWGQVLSSLLWILICRSERIICPLEYLCEE